MRRTLMTLSGRLRARWVCVLAAFLRSLVRRIICINTGLAWHETLHTLLTHRAQRARNPHMPLSLTSHVPRWRRGV